MIIRDSSNNIHSISEIVAPYCNYGVSILAANKNAWKLFTCIVPTPNDPDLLVGPCQKLRSFGINWSHTSVGSHHHTMYAAGVPSLVTLPGSPKTSQPIKRSGAVSICHSVTSSNKSGGVAQAIPVTDGSTSFTGTTTTLQPG